uniref:VASt domain-containing protein n=1 Tax=Steinernema glaseri TaxID=37863 RepID=A0A1I7ZJX7_9BILA
MDVCVWTSRCAHSEILIYPIKAPFPSHEYSLATFYLVIALIALDLLSQRSIYRVGCHCPMRPLVLLFLLFAFSLGREIPEFDDELLGRLVVSKKKFPFLTPKHALDQAHVYPTDKQLNDIKKAVGGPKKFALRVRRSLNDSGDDGFPQDPTAAFGWFENFQKFLGKFLKFEFSYEVLNSTIIDPKSLPFDKINSDAYFKAMVIDKELMKPYLENEFTPRIMTRTQAAPWYITRLRVCASRTPTTSDSPPTTTTLSFTTSSTSTSSNPAGSFFSSESPRPRSNADLLQYDKNTGGTMVYYKVTCMRVKDSYYIGLSTYDNNFVLHDIEHVDVVQSGWKFLFFGKSKTKIERWFEKRYVTLNDLKQLLDFIMRDFAERIRLEYRQYLEAANIPTPT